MIKKIRLKNLYSFSVEQIFSMEATRIREFDEPNCFYQKKNKMLKVASIHGLNGAGKSNLLQSIFHFKQLILQSHITGKDFIKKFETFKFLVNSEEIPSEIEINFIIDEVEYNYQVNFLKGNIVFESLSRKVSKEVLIFERKGASWEELTVAAKYLSSEKLNFMLKEFNNESTLILTVLGMLGEASKDIFYKIRNYFENNFFIINGMHEKMGMDITHAFLDKDKTNRKKILELMNKYSIGMDDFLYQSTEEIVPFEELKKNSSLPKELLEELENKIRQESSKMQISRKDVKISTVHKIFNEDNEKVGEEILDFRKYTSEGTKVLYNIAGAIFETLEKGGVLIIDEGLGLLHTIVLEDILKLFNSIESNPKNAQLIITGQNPYIMSDGNLRRDQIIIVTKKFGASLIKRLSDHKNIKSTHSFSKNYLNILRKTLQ